MTGTEVILLRLGKSVASAAVRRWLTERKARIDRSLPLSELINRRVLDKYGQRKVSREIEAMADAVAARLEPVLSSERIFLPENERNAALIAVVESFTVALESDEAIFLTDLDPSKLGSLVRKKGLQHFHQAALSNDGIFLYDTVLDECCIAFTQVIISLGPFPARASVEILSRLSGQGDVLNQLLSRIPIRCLDAPSGTDHDESFRKRYLSYIASRLNQLELFGVDTHNFRPRISLSMSYVSLTVSVDHHDSIISRSQGLSGNVRDETNIEETATLRVEKALGQSSRTLIRGEAGSGKTTILRWLATTAATEGFTGDLSKWNGCIPFFVRLRSFVGVALPRPEELLDDVAGPLSGLAPLGWVHRQLQSGAGLLLVDGLDELDSMQRRAAREWMQSILATFPAITVVATSRPAATATRWMTNEGFAPAMLERMTQTDVNSLIAHWHHAVREAPDLPCGVDQLSSYQGALIARLDANPHLQHLATTPLLCAMLCALNLDRRTHLPRDRMGIYAAAVDLLLERRDAERGIRTERVDISGRDQVQILQHLAWRMSINGRVEASRGDVITRISERLAAMPQVNATASDIYNHLLHRSGILREPVEGRVNFIHRVFQDYLTAREAAEHGDIGLLIAKAHLDSWSQIVVMAAGHANMPLRSELLEGILGRAATDPSHRRDLILLAASCMETVPALDPPELLHRLQAEIKGVVPPRSVTEARSLSAVGETILAYLPTSVADLPAAKASATIRTVAMINGPRALELLARHARDPRARVQRELLAAWRMFDSSEYARRVLADSPLINGSMRLTDSKQLPSVVHLNRLENLAVSFFEPADLSSLPSVPKLQRLDLGDGTTDDISILSQCADLRELRINNEHTPVDFESLRNVTQLNWLMYQHCAKIDNISALESLMNLTLCVLDSVSDLRDFAVLGDVPELIQLSISGFRLGTLSVIPRLDRMRLFSLQDSAELRRGLHELVESVPEVEHLEINKNSWVHEVGALRLLTRLKYLCLRDTHVEDLRPLAEMPSLERVDLVDCTGVISLDPLAELPNLKKIWVREVASKVQLGRLSSRSVRRVQQEDSDRCRLGRSINGSDKSRTTFVVEIGRRRVT